MSADLERRMRAARERWVDAAGVRLKIRRPLPLELAEIQAQSEINVRAAIVWRFVVGWDVAEATVLPGIGGEDRAEFSAGAWREFASGRVDVFNAALDEIMRWYGEHQAQTESVPGKSPSS